MNPFIKSPRYTGVLLLTPLALAVSSAMASPVTGGTMDPLTIPKYVTPLVIPPVMNNTGTANDYDIAVRQFKQQILPGGIWATLPGCAGQNCAFPATTVWSYGPAVEHRDDVADLVAPSAKSQFNYPAYTIENQANVTTTVDWINDLVDPETGKFRPHLLPVDRSLHWANPEQLPCLERGKTKDCQPNPANGPILQSPYDGPVPIITHVHGAHVTPESDGYPEAWWLATPRMSTAVAPRRGMTPRTTTRPRYPGQPVWPTDQQNGQARRGQLQLPERPALRHSLVPRPHPGHDP